MPFVRRLGLKAQTILCFTLLLLVTVSLLSTALIWRNHRRALTELIHHAASEGRSIGCSAEPYVLLGEERALNSVLRISAGDASLLSASITDAEGRTLACFARTAGFRPEISIDSRCPIPGEITRDSLRLERARNQITAVVPIWSGGSPISLGLVDEDLTDEEPQSRVIGYVTLIHCTDLLARERNQAIMSTLLIGGLLLCFGTGLAAFLVGQVLRPIANLASTAKAIQKGDLTRRADPDAVGEIGVLARTFNKMADSLSNYTHDLEDQVRRRTLALESSEAEARQLALAAEAANRAKSEFLANMSHEIRTPMTAILGFAENLDSDLSDLERREAITTIRRNGDHLLQIINDILDLSKIEAGKFQIQVQTCLLCQIVCEVASLMRVRAEAKGLTLTVRYGGPIPETIQADPTRLRQVLINLVNNAIKFTEQGGIRLDIELREGEAEPPMLQFQVVDTGIGMSPEQVASLFQPFTQVDNSMTRRFGGTGLGLAISKRLISVMGGTISVHSQPNAGSTFTIRVPTGPLTHTRMLERPVEIALGSEGPAGGGRHAAPGRLSGRILLAEDGLDNQRLISFILRKAGATVDVAENGRTAAEKAQAQAAAGDPYDLILMDMQMPILDGYGATRLLRQSGYKRPIVALTAHAMAGDREKCLAAGCDEFLTKPVDRRNLIQTLRSCIPQEEVAMASPEQKPTWLISEISNEPELADLIELFVNELPSRVESIRRALVDKDLEMLQMLAHQLKGAGGGYGFPSITAAARALEESVKAQADLAEVQAGVEGLAALCSRVRLASPAGSTP